MVFLIPRELDKALAIAVEDIIKSRRLLSESRSLNRDLAVLVPESRGQLRPLECTASAS